MLPTTYYSCDEKLSIKKLYNSEPCSATLSFLEEEIKIDLISTISYDEIVGTLPES